MNRSQFFAAALSLLALAPGSGFAANRRLPVEQVTADADKIVLGTVLSRSSHWAEDSRIYTDVVLSPDVAVKGAEQSSVLVQIPGGIVGDTQMTVSDAPEFREGERVLVFLRQNGAHFEIVGRGSGKYTVGSTEGDRAVDAAIQTLEQRGVRSLSGARGRASAFVAAAHRDAVVSRAASTTTSSGCNGMSGAKWPTGAAAFSIGSSVPADWAPSLNAATATWNSAGAAFTFTNDPNSVNQLSYLDLVAKYGSSYSNTYAVTTTWSNTSTNQISKATIEINTGFQWSTSGEANKADVQNIMTHEFGHWLRLDDIYSPSTCSEVTMWGYAALGETKKRTLEQPDIDGFVSLYGLKSSGITAPTLASPANGAANVSTTTSLTWTAVAGATGYDVYFGASTSPALVASVTSTAYQPGTLTTGATYYWRVVAKNSTTSASSATWSFTTASATTNPGGLAAPTLLSPANGATGVGLTPTLSWTAVSGATSYAVYVGTTPSPQLIGTTTGTAVRVSGFQTGVTYYWKIVARNSTASSPSSTVWSFRSN